MSVLRKLGLWMITIASGCGGSDQDAAKSGPPTCVPQSTRPCQCSATQTGVQTCNSEGSAYSACSQCEEVEQDAGMDATGCETVADCEDQNPCTEDACDAGSCNHLALTDETACGSGGVCRGGQCAHEVECTDPSDCDDGNVCTEEGCADARCGHTPVGDDTPCGTGLVCKSGQCEAAPDCALPSDCDDDNACTTDDCVAGECVNPAVAEGSVCGEAMVCRAGACEDVCQMPTVQWSAKAPLDAPEPTITAVTFEGRIHVFGYTHYLWHRVFDPSANTWAQLNDTPHDASEGAAAVVNGVLYAFNDGTFGNGNAMQWNQTADSWTVRAANPYPRRISAAGVIDGKVYLAGGFAGNGDKTNAYDPTSDTWQDLAPLTLLAGGVNAGVVHGGKLFAVGLPGGGQGPTRIATYDPATDAWTESASLSDSRYGARAIVRGDAIWLLGGSVNNVAQDSIFIYHVVADVWCPGPALPEANMLFAVEQVAGKIYVIGGNAGVLSYTEKVWEGVVQ